MNRLGNREIFRVAGPILLSLLFQQMIGLTDTAFLGRSEKSSSEPPRSAASGFSPSTCSASASASVCRS